MKKVLLFYIFSLLSEQLFAQYKVQFIVEDLSLQEHDSIYLAGTFTEWAAGNVKYLLKPFNGAKKSVTLNLPAGKHEYKFTRGNWLNVEMDYLCSDIQNRKIHVHNDTIIYITVILFQWKSAETEIITGAENYPVYQNSIDAVGGMVTDQTWTYENCAGNSDATQSNHAVSPAKGNPFMQLLHAKKSSHYKQDILNFKKDFLTKHK